MYTITSQLNFARGATFSATFLIVLLLTGVCSASSRPGLYEADQRFRFHPFQISFNVATSSITVGDATLALARELEHWQLQLKTRPQGILRLTGKGRIDEQAILPNPDKSLLASHYSYKQHGDNKRSYRAEIHPDGHRITTQYANKTSQLGFDGDVVDRLSATLALVRHLQKKPDFEQYQIRVLDGGKLKDVQYSNEGTENIELPFGRVDAIRVKRHRANSNRQTITWFAKLQTGHAQMYLPVKIEQYKKDQLRLRLVANNFRIVE